MNYKKYFLRVFGVVLMLGGMTAAVLFQSLSMGGVTGERSLFTIAKVQQMSLPIYSVEREDNKCSITFDCAWSADDIPEILKTLEEENVKATFFVVGTWAQKNKEMVKAILDHGHDVSCHGYTHLRFTALDKGRAREELLNFHKLIAEISGNEEWSGYDLFRAPYGDWSKSVVNLVGQEGYKCIQWDCDSLDWKPGISESTILERIKSKIAKGGIVLLHNSTPHTSKVLKDIIKLIKAENLEPVKTSELIYNDNYKIDNQGRQLKNTP